MHISIIISSQYVDAVQLLQLCEKLLKNQNNEELKALNSRVSRDISEQIESRLKELAEQVEIPL